MDLVNKVTETKSFLKPYFASSPEIAILTGTGLGEATDTISVQHSIEYSQIPNFSVSTVQSHSGKLIIGSLKNKSIMAMQGRFHLYEGYTALDVTFPIRVMKALGVKTIIVTNASGGLNQNFSPGDIMIITDHINLTGENPLVGTNIDPWGDRFPDMMAAYDKHLSELAEESAILEKIAIRKGVYAGLKGPSLETPAEVRFLQTIGAHAVGFSTVMEVIAATHSSMKVLGLSIVTNVHNPDNPVPAIVDDIIDTANLAAPKLEKLISAIVEKI